MGHVPYLLFTVQTPLTKCSQEMRDFAAPYLKNPTHDSLKSMANALIMKMPFVKDVTHVGTTAAESFATSAGVCQESHSCVFGLLP